MRFEHYGMPTNTKVHQHDTLAGEDKQELADPRFKGSMPPLSAIVPPGIMVGGSPGAGAAGEGADRKGMVRTRIAPAGPHPYLDRFVSGMHRPLEGKPVVKSDLLRTAHTSSRASILRPHRLRHPIREPLR